MPKFPSADTVADDTRPVFETVIGHGSLLRVGDGFLVQQTRPVRSQLNPTFVTNVPQTVAHLHLTPEEARQWMSALADFAYPQDEPVDVDLLLAEAAEAEV
ncbi:hypothetical protein [Gryllotalpicola koreensis]|uniref:MmcQ/YjbR family DNA-binding protein n=1 Tax=Gryllotalpicola koreensis TaxID=993086 RepID=A0ABP8A2P9_9MICO